jgi:phytoene synthase
VTTLEESYRCCRQLNRRHGTTYFWSTQLLPAIKRPHVHALYAFCRYADDIVDDLGPAPTSERAEALAAYGARFFADLAAGRSEHPVLRAVVHTVRAFDIDRSCFARFLRSMTLDLTVTEYLTFADLADYMDGSAAVIGEMMLPILEPTSSDATAPARDLGLAFQLTNFCRDVAEDLDRGRVYLPIEDIEYYGARPALEARAVTPEWVELMRFEIARTREYYRSADLGLPMLPSVAGRCIAGARLLYGGILDQIEAADYDVFTARVRVPTWRKLAVAARLVTPARRPVLEGAGHDRAEHPVRLAAVEMVDGVGIPQPLERRKGGHLHEAAVNVDVVDEGIGRPVGSDTYADRHEQVGRTNVSANGHDDNGQAGEHNGEPVVGFEALAPARRGPAPVVGTVQHPSGAVHDPAMGGIGGRLHEHEGDQTGDNDRNHGRRLSPPGSIPTAPFVNPTDKDEGDEGETVGEVLDRDVPREAHTDHGPPVVDHDRG